MSEKVLLSTLIFPRRRSIDTRSRAHDRARPTDSRADTMGVNDHDTFSGLTPLHEAAANGDLAKVVEIMDDGADVNIRACGEVRARRREIDSRAVTMVSLCLRVRGGGGRGREARRARERRWARMRRRARFAPYRSTTRDGTRD